MKGEKLQHTCHSRLLIIGVTRCLRTHTEKAEPGLSSESVKTLDLLVEYAFQLEAYI